MTINRSRLTARVRASTPARRRFLGGFATLLAVLAIAAAGCSSGAAREPVTEKPAAPADDGASGGGTSLRTADGSTSAGAPPAEGSSTPEPTVGSIDDLVDQFGHPPGYDFGELRIPAIGVAAPIGISVVDGAAGTEIGSPEGPATLFWYNFDAWEGLGGVPGEGGNAVFGGHVDISAYLPYADVTYHGPAVFRDLFLLVTGDRIVVDRNGVTLEYAVSWSEQINAGDSNRWGEIWSADVETDSITLYTCGGDFDWNSLSYADRYVVRATLISSL
jgi:hypothetical protein